MIDIMAEGEEGGGALDMRRRFSEARRSSAAPAPGTWQNQPANKDRWVVFEGEVLWAVLASRRRAMAGS